MDIATLWQRLPGWHRDLRRWRRGRPFWGGLLLLLGGIELLYSANLNPAGMQVHAPGFEGFMSYLLPALLILAGVLVWVTPRQRVFYGVVGVITAVYSLIGLNLGGFFAGALLGIVGGALSFAWTPVPATAATTSPDTGADEPARGGPRHLAAVILLAVLAAVPALAAAPRVALHPGRMTASTLRLEGFTYRGVVSLPTANGSVRVLKFTMDRSVSDNFKLVITDGGHSQQLTSNPLTVAGNVEFYTSRFSGRLLGIPLTFTPTFPPPVTLPTMTFTSVVIDLVLLDCDTLTAPTLHQISL